MKIPFGFCLCLIFAVGSLQAQLSLEHLAMNNLTKHKWEKARMQFLKVLRKDSLDASAHYGLSLYFFDKSNPNFQIDTAYRYAVKAIVHYQATPQRQRDRWRKLPMDSTLLVWHRERIDSAAFERAVQINTEVGYIEFIARFSMASQQSLASELRDEVAFLDALRENTVQSFLNYMNKYPEASRYPEAKHRCEKLLYEIKTKDKKLSSYESFLAQYPSTPYRREVEQQIFEIATAGGEEADYMNFIKRNPHNHKLQTAQNILYHLLREEDKDYSFLLNDSLRHLESLEKYVLIPFLKDGKFGFMNEQGDEIFKPEINTINDGYRCGNIIEKLILIDDKIVARNGALVYKGEVEEVEDLGYGFLKIKSTSCAKIIHYSGFEIGNTECIEDAKILGANFLAIQKGEKWGVFTFTGRMLIPFEWDEVSSIEKVLVFSKSNQFKLIQTNSVARVADQFPLEFLPQQFDEVRAWSKGMVWVQQDDRQAVLNQNLKPWIEFRNEVIMPTFFGAVGRNQIGSRLYVQGREASEIYSEIKINEPWVIIKTDAYHLLNPFTGNQSQPLDSIYFSGPLAIALRGDSLHVHMPGGVVVESTRKVKSSFVAGTDSTFYLLMEEDDKKKLYNERGQLLFSVNFDHIEYNNEGYFTIYKRDKRGLINTEGKVVVQPEYDAMGPVTNGVVAVIKDRKFGSLNFNAKKQIKAEYEKNLLQYNQLYFTAFKKGFYGLIGWDNKPVIPFEYDEIRYWDDSSAMVRKNYSWIIYNFINKKIVVDKIESYKRVLLNESEKVIIFKQNNYYGVLSNKRGTFILSTFSDIINVGSAATPLYFTEKYVEEASIYIVIYYDRYGNNLRKQVYEADDYEKIYCVQNNN